MKELLSGNEAIARGAFEHGVRVAAAYPGTPSTEILENLSTYDGVYTEWAPNEKVAYEVAFGACLAGTRSMAVMKHVGLNVASDPLMTSSYTGVRGGFVVVVADDPGMHSSQNEQDSRNYARFAKVPLFEPSDAQEAKALLGTAFEVSERFDTPVIFRSTTRISHSKGIVELGERKEGPAPEYEKDPSKYLMVPGNARNRRVALEERTGRLTEFCNGFEGNRADYGNTDIGIITSSISYQYVMEVFGDFSILKLSMSYPFPDDLIRTFASKVEKLIVVEELDPFILEHVKSLGLHAEENLTPRIGELNPDILLKARRTLTGDGDNTVGSAHEETQSPADPPARPPVLCPGCPHRTVFYGLKKHKPIVIGDIGCYSLGGLPPLESMDAIICMGAGISAAMGVSKSGIDRPVVGIVGDSTFFHSGITGLLDIGYNRGNVTIIVLDNRITAMTGHQNHPGTGKTLSGEDTFRASIERFGEAAGIGRIRVFDPYDLEETAAVLGEEIECPEPSLLISRRPCLLSGGKTAPPFHVDADGCKACGICFKLGCPALAKETDENGEWKAVITQSLCTGCSVCAQACPFDAIVRD